MYLLLGGQSEPPTNAVQTECYKELPPTLLSAPAMGQNALQAIKSFLDNAHFLKIISNIYKEFIVKLSKN